jgi:hypothetical protein
MTIKECTSNTVGIVLILIALIILMVWNIMDELK